RSFSGVAGDAPAVSMASEQGGQIGRPAPEGKWFDLVAAHVGGDVPFGVAGTAGHLFSFLQLGAYGRSEVAVRLARADHRSQRLVGIMAHSDGHRYTATTGFW